MGLLPGENEASHLLLARLLRLGEIVPVAVPTLAQEAARDLVRAREDVRGDLMRARHRTSKLLLRQGIVWAAGTAWTVAHHDWLRGQSFPDRALAVAYDSALETVLVTADRRDRLDKVILRARQRRPGHGHRATRAGRRQPGERGGRSAATATAAQCYPTPIKEVTAAQAAPKAAPTAPAARAATRKAPTAGRRRSPRSRGQQWLVGNSAGVSDQLHGDGRRRYRAVPDSDNACRVRPPTRP